MAEEFGAGSPPRIGAARRLFKTELQPTYNLDHFEPSNDGQRFLIRRPRQEGARSALNVVVNWPSAVTAP
jgi:hypothetical protein